MTAKSLLDENPHPTEDDVRDYLRGNLCRCTGYASIVRAVLAAAETSQSELTIRLRCASGIRSFSATMLPEFDCPRALAMLAEALNVLPIAGGTNVVADLRAAGRIASSSCAAGQPRPCARWSTSAGCPSCAASGARMATWSSAAGPPSPTC